MAEELQLELYYGRSRHGIEKSYRLLVPKEWRMEGGPKQFLVIPWPWEKEVNDYLMVLPMTRYATVLDRLKQHSFNNDKVADFKRVVGSSSKKVEFDGFGRLALSETLLREAGIANEAELVGCIDHFEIWNPVKFQSARDGHKKSAGEIKQEVFV